MNKCVFCKLSDNIFDRIIKETNHFYIKPTLGSIVPNYLLIITKKHITSFSELNSEELKELTSLLNKCRKMFYKKFSKYPIIFEHGTIDENSSSSITHAHIHIVLHNFTNENEIIDYLKMKRTTFNSIFNKNIKKSYIFYINEKNEVFITYDFKKERQIMRKFIAKDVSKEDKWNWKKYPFINNIKITIKNFTE